MTDQTNFSCLAILVLTECDHKRCCDEKVEIMILIIAHDTRALKQNWNWKQFVSPKTNNFDSNPRYHFIKTTIIPNQRAFVDISTAAILRWHYWKLHIKHSILYAIVMQILLRRLFQFNSCVVAFCVCEAYDDIHVRLRISIASFFALNDARTGTQWINHEIKSLIE